MPTETHKDPHYIKVPCFLTGRLVLDTDRERIRQKLAKHLVHELGYRIEDFILDRGIPVEFNGKRQVSIIDLLVVIDGRSLMVLRFGPGSVITRESGTISAARLVEPDYIVPWAVQANLFDASFIDVVKKKAVGYGWEAIPSRSDLMGLCSTWPPPVLPPERIPFEERILFSYDKPA